MDKSVKKVLEEYYKKAAEANRHLDDGFLDGINVRDDRVANRHLINRNYYLAAAEFIEHAKRLPDRAEKSAILKKAKWYAKSTTDLEDEYDNLAGL